MGIPNANNMNRLKQLSKEEFLQLHGATEELYESIQKSKSGFIRIKRTTGDPYSIGGYTELFAEGLSLFVSNNSEWLNIPNVTYINWDKGWFDTLNSRYNFIFEEEKNEN